MNYKITNKIFNVLEQNWSIKALSVESLKTEYKLAEKIYTHNWEDKLKIWKIDNYKENTHIHALVALYLLFIRPL